MTGYLPLTSVAAKAVEASAQYAKNPAHKTAFDQMKAAKATPNIRLRRVPGGRGRAAPAPLGTKVSPENLWEGVAFCKSSPRNPVSKGVYGNHSGPLGC